MMLCCYGIFLSGLVLTVVAPDPTLEEPLDEPNEVQDPTVDKLQKEIRKVRADTHILRMEAEKTKKEISSYEELIAKADAEIESVKSRLKQEEKELIEKMHGLDVTITAIEKLIKFEKEALLDENEYYYRLQFIIKLLREDLVVARHRRAVGDEVSCYNFLRNGTGKRPLYYKAQRSIKLATNSLSNNLSPTEREILQLHNKLEFEMFEHEDALKDLASLREELNNKIEEFKLREKIEKELVQDGVKYVKEATRSVIMLEKDLIEVKEEEAKLYAKVKENLEKDNPLLELIKRLKEELSTFEKANKCYKNLEREY